MHAPTFSQASKCSAASISRDGQFMCVWQSTIIICSRLLSFLPARHGPAASHYIDCRMIRNLPRACQEQRFRTKFYNFTNYADFFKPGLDIGRELLIIAVVIWLFNGSL